MTTSTAESGFEQSPRVASLRPPDNLPGDYYLVTSIDGTASAAVLVWHSAHKEATIIEQRGAWWAGSALLLSEAEGSAQCIADADVSPPSVGDVLPLEDSFRVEIHPPERDPAALQNMILYVGDRALNRLAL